jgi:hypothetical protein
MKTLCQIKEERNPLALTSDRELCESLVGKGFAIGQNRQHAANKTKLLSILTQIQNDCRQGVRENEQNKKIDLIFQVAFEFASAMKTFAEMSTSTNNISTTAVLDTENIQKAIEVTLSKRPKQ